MQWTRVACAVGLLIVAGFASACAIVVQDAPGPPAPRAQLVFATPTPTPALVVHPEATVVAAPTPPAGRRIDTTFNVVLLGSDRRQSVHTVWRTDTIMLFFVDMARREVAVASIPRDTYVTIPGYGKQRINVVDYFGEAGVVKAEGGGPGLLRKVFWENFHVRVDRYVRIDLEGFAKVVDVLGGVDVDIACPRTVTWGGETYYFAKGRQHLSGPELIIYVRARQETSDIDRIRRQQRAILAMRERARELNLLPRLPQLLIALRQSVQTDLSIGEMWQLGRLAMDIPVDQVHGLVIGYPLVRGAVTPAGESVLVPDLPGIQKALENVFAQPTLLEATAHGVNCGEE